LHSLIQSLNQLRGTQYKQITPATNRISSQMMNVTGVYEGVTLIVFKGKGFKVT